MKNKITIGDCLHCVLREAIEAYADVHGDKFSMGEAIHGLSCVIGEYIVITSIRSGCGADGVRTTVVDQINEVLASHKDKTIPPGTTHH